VTPCSSLTHPIPFSCTGVLFPATPVSSGPPPGQPHSRQPSPPLPILDPDHKQDPRRSLILLDPSKLAPMHQNHRTVAPASLFPPPSLGLPSIHRYKASPPRSTAPSAPHHPPEAIQPLLHRPPSPKPAKCRTPLPPVRTEPHPAVDHPSLVGLCPN
jgi:hypothetical protein